MNRTRLLFESNFDSSNSSTSGAIPSHGLRAPVRCLRCWGWPAFIWRSSIRATVEGCVKVVEAAENNPQKWLTGLHEAGIKVIHKCTSVPHATKAEAIGCDTISADGFECGGHPREDELIDRIMHDAEFIIDQRLAKLRSA